MSQPEVACIYSLSAFYHTAKQHSKSVSTQTTAFAPRPSAIFVFINYHLAKLKLLFLEIFLDIKYISVRSTKAFLASLIVLQKFVYNVLIIYNIFIDEDYSHMSGRYVSFTISAQTFENNFYLNGIYKERQMYHKLQS